MTFLFLRLCHVAYKCKRAILGYKYDRSFTAVSFLYLLTKLKSKWSEVLLPAHRMVKVGHEPSA